MFLNNSAWHMMNSILFFKILSSLSLFYAKKYLPKYVAGWITNPYSMLLYTRCFPRTSSVIYFNDESNYHLIRYLLNLMGRGYQSYWRSPSASKWFWQFQLYIYHLRFYLSNERKCFRIELLNMFLELEFIYRYSLY